MKEKFNEIILDLQLSSSYDHFNEGNLITAARALTQLMNEMTALIDLGKLTSLGDPNTLLGNLLSDLNSTSTTPLFITKHNPPKETKPKATEFFTISISDDNSPKAMEVTFSKIDENVAQLKNVLNLPVPSKGKNLLDANSDIVVATAAIADQLQNLSNSAKKQNRQGLIDAGRRVHILVKDFNKDLKGYSDKAKNPTVKSRLMQITNSLSNYSVQLKILSSVKAASNQFDKASDDQIVSMCAVLTEALVVAVPTVNTMILTN